MTASPLAMADISVIVPMGGAASGPSVDPTTGGGAHVIPSDHINIGMNNPIPPKNIYAPADGYLLQIMYVQSRWLAPDGSRLDDYALTFQIAKNLFVYVTHMTDLSADVKGLVGTLKPANAGNLFQFPIKAGTLMGVTGGSTYLKTFDLIADDVSYSPPGFFLTRYYKDPPISVDPIAYYDEPLRSQLYAMLPNRPAPRIGRYYYDLQGELVGAWCAGPEAAKDPVIMFCYDNLDPSQLRVADQGVNTVYAIYGNAPDPATITVASGLTKYEIYDASSTSGASGPHTVLLVKMLDNLTLETEYFPGKTAAQVSDFDANAVTTATISRLENRDATRTDWAVGAAKAS